MAAVAAAREFATQVTWGAGLAAVGASSADAFARGDLAGGLLASLQGLLSEVAREVFSDPAPGGAPGGASGTQAAPREAVAQEDLPPPGSGGAGSGGRFVPDPGALGRGGTANLAGADVGSESAPPPVGGATPVGSGAVGFDAGGEIEPGVTATPAPWPAVASSGASGGATGGAGTVGVGAGGANGPGGAPPPIPPGAVSGATGGRSGPVEVGAENGPGTAAPAPPTPTPFGGGTPPGAGRQDANAIVEGMERARAGGTGGGTQVAAGSAAAAFGAVPEALPAVGEAVKDAVAAVGSRVGPSAAAAAPEVAAAVGAVAVVGGMAAVAAAGPIGHAAVEGYDGSVPGRAPVMAEVDARAGTVTLYRPDAGGAPLPGTSTATLTLGADGALRDSQGVAVGRLESGRVVPHVGVSVQALLRDPAVSTPPRGPGLGEPVDGYDVAPSAAAQAPSAPAVAPDVVAPASGGGSGGDAGVRVNLGGALLGAGANAASGGAMPGDTRVDLGTGSSGVTGASGSGGSAGGYGGAFSATSGATAGGGAVASASVASPGTGSPSGAQASAMTGTAPVGDGTVSTPVATPLPQLPGYTPLPDAARQVLDRPETLPIDPNAGTPQANVTYPTPALPQIEGMTAAGPQGPQVMAMVAPTPRDGVIGGKPTGTPEAINPRADRDTQRGIELQIASGNAMAAAGYRVEWSPEVLPEDNIGFDKKPDMRLGGNITDVVAPRSSNPDQVRKAVSEKVSAGQAYHIILNLGRTDATREQVEALLRRPGKEITGLQELFIIEKNGAISRFLPEPEQIIPAPQAR